MGMTDVQPADVRNSETVHRWLASRLDLWGRKALNDELVETLTRFCQRVGKAPDEMVDDCLRPGKERDVYVLRTRARREYMEQIEAFEAETGSRDQANIVRSFLIHNGVAMNPNLLP